MFPPINVDFENCYGISKLSHRFKFEHGKLTLIYSPNGSMKTSLAKTFLDISKGRTPEDLIFPERKTKFPVTVHDDAEQTIIREISAEEIFVIESLNDGYKSDKTQRLLVNPELKKEYEVAIADLDEKRKALLTALKKTSGLASKTEPELMSSLGSSNDDIDTVLGRYDRDVRKPPNDKLMEISYKVISDPKVIEFLALDDSASNIQEYTDKYNDLLEQSTFFKSGVFDHNNAETIATNLETNGFFEAGNKVVFSDVSDLEGVETKSDLITLIEGEKDKIFSDKALKAAFDKLDKQLTKNQKLKDFRSLISTKPQIISLLDDVEALKKVMWIEFLKANKSAYTEYLESLDLNGPKITEIRKTASREAPRWLAVIKEFNDRFSVPFELKIANLQKVSLEGAPPVIGFAYRDQRDDSLRSIDEEKLKKVLSRGERRALYILNIIFEVKARELGEQKTLFVIDDIADSFDYKNKYAIVQYLSDMADSEFFYLLVLTHNFDFFRTVKSRVSVYGDDKLIATRLTDKVLLTKETIGENPFANWRDNLDDASKFIATIPFARNLADILGKTAESNVFSQALHFKPGQRDITKSEIQTAMKSVLGDIIFPDNTQESITSFIIRITDDIARDATENVNLEDKIALSIGIRILAERAMVSLINDEAYVNSVAVHQTGKFLGKIKKNGLASADVLSIFSDVCLMTPENIHLNSFMFEPILDMSAVHLKRLFGKVRDLNSDLELS